MLKQFRCCLILVLCLQVGCTSPETEIKQPEPCSDEWNHMVESRFHTGDSMGHGPDVGSQEWQSVVEFKLGIRGNPDVPNLGSPQWCSYIDDHIRSIAQ